jgi:2Fe-2S ferredoxin
VIIRVVRGNCAGHALCATKVPELYEVDEDGYCISDGRIVPAEMAERARLGARFCPERAITLEDAPNDAIPVAATTMSAPQLTIRFRRPDGRTRDVPAILGLSIMRVAQDSGIEGIVGECGGSCSCATCHVYIDAEHAQKLPPVSAVEEEMLECVAAERRPGSRLGCQIDVTRDLDGLIVHIPDRQS